MKFYGMKEIERGSRQAESSDGAMWANASRPEACVKTTKNIRMAPDNNFTLITLSSNLNLVSHISSLAEREVALLGRSGVATSRQQGSATHSLTVTASGSVTAHLPNAEVKHSLPFQVPSVASPNIHSFRKINNRTVIQGKYWFCNDTNTATLHWEWTLPSPYPPRHHKDTPTTEH